YCCRPRFLFCVWLEISPTIVPRGHPSPLKGLFWVIGTLVALGGYCLTLARRLRTAPVVIPSSKESVLYLRAFDDERRPFAVGPRRKLERYTNQLDVRMPSPAFMPGGNPTIRLTLDDFLEEAINTRMGRFVALGNPADRLPPRRGGLRIRSRRGLETPFLRSCPEREVHRHYPGRIGQSTVGAQSDQGTGNVPEGLHVHPATKRLW